MKAGFLSSIHGLARGLGLFSLFAVAFAGTCWLANMVLPFPAVPEVTPKRAHLAAHGDEYDAIFIGSSRVDIQIVPTVFDQRMAELGYPMRTFNAGISAMTPPEDGFVFDEIARLPHRRLRWVFIELDQVRLEPDRCRPESGRFVYWHDAARMRLLWGRFLIEWRLVEKKLTGKKQKKWSWFQRMEARRQPLTELSAQLSAFFQNQTNLGRGAALATRFAQGGEDVRYFSEIDPATAGWSRADGSLQDKDREEYERTYADRLTAPQTPLKPDPASAEALRRIVKRVQAIGATPVLLVSPTTRRSQFMPPEDLQRSCLILNFSDVRAFPDLYRPEHRLDVEHLNQHGAPFYSRLLAEQFFAATRPSSSR